MELSLDHEESAELARGIFDTKTEREYDKD